MVVLAGEHDEPLGPIERLPEPGDVVTRIVATGPRRRDTVEEGERVVPQVHRLEVELGPFAQVPEHPVGRPVR